MRGLFAYTVDSYDGPRRHHLGDFRRLTPACSAARLALNSPRVSLAVVKDRDGALVFAVDAEGKEWQRSSEDPMPSRFATIEGVGPIA